MTAPQSRRDQRLAAAALGVALVVLASTGVYSTMVAQELATSGRLVAHTLEVIEELQGIGAGMSTAEAALRGYALNRDPELISDVGPAASEARAALAAARKLFADNPAQAARLEELARTLDRRLRLLDERARLIESLGDTTVSPEAQALSDEVRAQVGALVSVEEGLLAERRALTDQKTSQTLRTVPIAVVLSSLLVIGTMVVLLREMRRRQKAERAASGQLHELTLLLEMGELLQACRSTDEAYDVMTQLAPRFFAETSGAISLFRASRDVLEARSRWGSDSVLSADILQPEDCWALRRGQPHRVRLGGEGVRCHHAVGALATLCVPLLAHGELLGCLHLASSTELPEHRLRTASAVGERSAMALANLRLRETLRDQSIRDPLTGLFNRRYTEETLARELARAKRSGEAVTLIMVDVDHFKKFNDTFGHEAGDHVLKEIGSLLQRLTRNSDVASRLGGEELLVILPGFDTEGAIKRGEELRAAVASLSLHHRGQGLGKVTASFGLASYPVHGTTADELLRNADLALYAAKREGRDRLVTAGAASSGATSTMPA